MFGVYRSCGNEIKHSLRNHCANFDASRSCESGDKTFLFCQMALRDHMVKATNDLINGTASS